MRSRRPSLRATLDSLTGAFVDAVLRVVRGAALDAIGVVAEAPRARPRRRPIAAEAGAAPAAGTRRRKSPGKADAREAEPVPDDGPIEGDVVISDPAALLAVATSAPAERRTVATSAPAERRAVEPPPILAEPPVTAPHPVERRHLPAPRPGEHVLRSSGGGVVLRRRSPSSR